MVFIFYLANKKSQLWQGYSVHRMHKTQEEVWDDRGGVQGKQEAEGTSSVGGGVGGGSEAKECW